jgi:hypothetical protein
MARTKKGRTKPSASATPPRRRRPSLAALLPAALGIAGAAAVATFVLNSDDGASPAADPGPVHVHGLGVNPSDDSLFIATHTGLYRTAQDESRAERVGESSQDTMGFTVVGPDHFLGSGHPDLRQQLPPLLGLIESTDAGKSWEPISLLGQADFHVLRSSRDTVYGYDASNDRLLTSTDEGRSWNEIERPGALLDLAVHPAEREHLLASAQGAFGAALFASRDAGRSWRIVGDALGFLAWPAPDRLYVVTLNGEVLRSADGGSTFEQRGEIGGEPAALLAHRDDLYVALHDGTIKQSADGGASWTIRSLP